MAPVIGGTRIALHCSPGWALPQGAPSPAVPALEAPVGERAANAEFAAATPEEYIQTATRFANDLPRLAAIRDGMRERLKGSPLLAQQRFTRNLESIYRDVWRKYASA